MTGAFSLGAAKTWPRILTGPQLVPVGEHILGLVDHRGVPVGGAGDLAVMADDPVEEQGLEQLGRDPSALGVAAHDPGEQAVPPVGPGEAAHGRSGGRVVGESVGERRRKRGQGSLMGVGE